jgi:hypothetical protein
MSNASILERLESELSIYEDGKISREKFVEFLANSVRALEGVPSSVVHELRKHKYTVETEGYLEDEGFESNPDAARRELRTWIEQLKGKYCAGNC